MVSTRSQSIITNSTIRADDPQALHGEVTSKQTSTRRQAPPTASRRTRKQAEHELEAIAEDQQLTPAPTAIEASPLAVLATEKAPPSSSKPSSSTRARRNSRQLTSTNSPEAAAADQTQADALVSSMAQNLLAALADDDDSDGASEEEASLSLEESSESDFEGVFGRGSARKKDLQGGESDEEEEGKSGKKGGHRGPKIVRWRPEMSLPGLENKAGGKNGNGLKKGIGGILSVEDAEAAVESLAGMSRVPHPDKRLQQREAKKGAPDTAGKAWYDLPAPTITDEVKNDLRMIRLRSAFDPKTFYKKFDSTKFPKYFQMGRVVEDATDFYSSRMARKERKQTFTEEIQSDPHLADVRKRRYTRMQEEKMYWGNKRGRKTDNPREKKKPKKPKH